MVTTERAITVLRKISKEIELLVEDLTNDGFEEYADTLQDTLDKLSALLYGLKQETN